VYDTNAVVKQDYKATERNGFSRTVVLWGYIVEG
jgi:hypothetical protein